MNDHGETTHIDVKAETAAPPDGTAQQTAEGQETAAQQQPKPVKIGCSRGLAGWLLRHNVSIAFTSYQTGRLYLVGVDQNRRVAFHERYFARAMALWTDPQRLLLATIFQLWRFENVLGKGQAANGSDRHYVPRIAHTTGDLDIHDIGVLENGRIVFVNTAYSCLAMLSSVHSFRPIWRPPFISKLAPEDRCHLNGMAMKDNKPAYVTAVCRSDIVNGWRDRRAEGGCVIDVQTNNIVTEKLSMPHSPRLHRERLWVLNSGTGYLGSVNDTNGEFEPRVFCPGFLRGLAFHDGHAIVGLSLPRNGSFAGLQLDDELKKRDAEPWCGIQIIDLATDNIVQWIRLEGGASELFDVRVIPGVRQPTCTGILSGQIQSLITIERPRRGSIQPPPN